MLEEIEVHEKRYHWKVMGRKDLPPEAKTIMAIWSFKRKQYPDGSLNRHKSRLCAHGGQQTWGQDYWDTYAPLVTWASVRLILVVAKILKIDYKSIDFVPAFPQADLPILVFMDLPAGVTSIDKTYSNRKRYGPVGSNHSSLQNTLLLALGHRALQDLPRCTVRGSGEREGL